MQCFSIRVIGSRTLGTSCCSAIFTLIVLASGFELFVFVDETMRFDRSMLITTFLICCISSLRVVSTFRLSHFTSDALVQNHQHDRRIVPVLPSTTCLFAHRMPPLNSEEEYIRTRRNLELRWKLMQSNDECDVEDMYSCGGPCDICDGEGVVECRFCQGTGFLTIGETIYSGKDCPVCSGAGEEECKSCMGRKWVAKWRQIDPSLLAGTKG